MTSNATQEELNLSIEDLKSSWENSPHPTVKITSYFPAYAELFGHLRGRECTFIETGVLDGGSLFMWKNWLGDKARIIGIDLNPEARKWQSQGFEIYIGDQGDPEFWRVTLKEIGKFDALLDDGGHQSFQQIVTTIEAINHSKHKCVVVVEDTATSFMKDFSSHGKHSFLQFSKDSTDVLIGRSTGIYSGRFPTYRNEEIIEQFKNVYSIQFYNGIVAFKINPTFSVKPELARNRPSNLAGDFRYKGKDSAYVNWPQPFIKKMVLVKGGQSHSSFLSGIKVFIDDFPRLKAFMKKYIK